MLHDGEMRRSEDELGEVMRSGTSAALWIDIFNLWQVELTRTKLVG
jgi:hypothetical protein